MRRSVTLDPDVLERLEHLARARHSSLEKTLNQVLRSGLPRLENAGAARSFFVTPHRASLRVGLDALKLNQLVDGLEVQDFRSETGRSARRRKRSR